uniref:Transposase n=1 Tax=Strongyloides venezuelensis TaxID=75913 RepID=A0A0K0FBA5_STRVS
MSKSKSTNKNHGFRIGDQVYKKLLDRVGNTRKLEKGYKGPYKLTTIDEETGNCQLQSISRYGRANEKKLITAHIKQLKLDKGFSREKKCIKSITGPLIHKPSFRSISKIAVNRSLNDVDYHHEKKLIFIKRIHTYRFIGGIICQVVMLSNVPSIRKR